jgi:thiol-disulfide isomerase/thioredoxin
VRNLAWVSVLVAGLAVGCTGPGKRSSPPPASGFSAGDAAPTGIGNRAQQPQTTGLLAGRVIDAFDRQAAKASIQVVARPDGRSPTPAPIEVQADERGCFFIPGLDPGQPYQLIARLKEGNKIIAAGKTWARPPNPRMVIRVSEDLVSEDTPPVPARPTYPQEPKPDKAKKKETTPAASIDRPVVPRQDLTSGSEVSPPSPPPQPRRPLRLEHVISVPPQVPPADPEEQPAVPRLPTPSTPQAKAPQSQKPPEAPWCSLYGRQLEDFALFDPDGKVWEYRRDHRGKLVLLDFWHTRCPPCLRAIPHLNGLQREYGASGLEIIGIACDSDSPSQRAVRVRSLRWGANGPPVRFEYRVLLWGDRGAGKPCPVFTDFGIAAFPTVKLIDQDGRIVWESQGLDGSRLNELRREIETRLNVSRR